MNTDIPKLGSIELLGDLIFEENIDLLHGPNFVSVYQKYQELTGVDIHHHTPLLREDRDNCRIYWLPTGYIVVAARPGYGSIYLPDMSPPNAPRITKDPCPQCGADMFLLSSWQCTYCPGCS